MAVWLLSTPWVAFSQSEYAQKEVVLGYGLEKTNATSTESAVTVSGDKIRQSGAISLQNALYGRLPGLIALQNGGFYNDNGAILSVRGQHSLSYNDILILVDGFERPINTLTLDEIESVTVLKDAAAIARYGFKAINGVIYVKTKRGTSQKLDVQVRYDHGFDSAFRLPEMVDAYTYANALNEARANDGLSPYYNAYEVDAFKNNTYPDIYPNVDWEKETLRKMAFTETYHLSFRGGDSKLRYYTMLNLNRAHGLFNHTETDDYSSQLKYSQGNIRTNIDLDFSPSSKLSLNITGIFFESSRPTGFGPNDLMSRIYQIPAAAFPVKTADGYWGGDSKWTDDNPVANIAATGYGRDHGRSLYADLQYKQGLDIITKGLSATLRFGYDNHANYWEKRQTEFEYASDRYVFDQFGNPINTTRVQGGNKATQLAFSKSLNRQWRHSNFLASVDYEKNLGKHALNASIFYTADGLIENEQNNTFYRQNFGAHVGYNYGNRYLADLTLMYSGSNRLAFFPSRYGFSPALSAAWVLSEESFLKGSDIVNFLKLRASAGILCSDYTPDLNISEQSFGGGNGFYFGDNYTSFGGNKENRLPNTNPKPEKAYIYNAGIDAELFRSLSFSVEGYFQRNSDILCSEGGMNSAVLGVSSPYVNAGVMDSYGVDLGVNFLRTFGKFRVEAGVNYMYTRNRIRENMDEPVAYSYLDKRGNSLSQCYGLEAIGFFRDQEEIDNYPIRQTFGTVRPGDIKYKDQNNDGEINENDVVPIGYDNVTPRHYFGIDLNLEYRGFGINLMFQGVSKFSKFLTTTGVFRPITNNTNISEYYLERRWIPGADNSNAEYPALSYEDNKNNNRNSTVWIKDASYLRLRNCELYYNFPKALISKIRLSALKLYVRGENLLCWDSIKVMDPENTGTRYPITKAVHVGIMLNF